MNIAELKSMLFGAEEGAEVSFDYNGTELRVEHIATPHSGSVVVQLGAATVQEPVTVEDNE